MARSARTAARLERVWPDEAAREREREACRAWLAEQRALPRLAALARLLLPGLTLRQFDCVRVPVERAIARLEITDVEILDADLPPEAPVSPPLPLTVVADSIRSAFNVGGLFRTAECFGVREVLLCGYTPSPEQPQAARAAARAPSGWWLGVMPAGFAVIDELRGGSAVRRWR